MPETTIEDALRITLEDHRLSRSEKRALAKVIEQHVTDDHALSHARSVAFDLARHEIKELDDSSATASIPILDWLEEAIKALSQHPANPSASRSEAFFSPQDNCVSKIIRLFEQSRSAVDICVYTITDDRIKEAILAAHHRGVQMRIISDNDKSHDLGSDVDQLEQLGIPVRCDRRDSHMHHKYALFDGKTMMTGSYNWTRSAANFNEENFIVTGDSNLVDDFGEAFERLWKQLS
ncbi:MAG: phospholipase D-like domain-containing protein [Rubripirellula sp.]